MADEQAYKLTNFKKILSYYSALVENAMFEEVEGLHAETPFRPESWTYYVSVDNADGTTTTEEVVVANPGYNYAMELLKMFKTTSSNILDALMTLFINNDDPKEMRQEEFNFNILNAYASASQSLQWYNKDTEEFETMPEYWFTRGCWYDMLPMCTKGDYIKAKYPNVLNAIKAIKRCRHYYEYEYKYPVPLYYDDYGYSYSDYGGYSYRSSNGRYRYYSYRSPYAYNYIGYSQFSNSREFTLSFWDTYLQTLSSEVSNYLNPIWKFGKPSGLKEQTASTAKLTYVTQLASDFGKMFQRNNTAVKTAKQLLTTTSYDAKKAKVSISK